MIDIVMHQLFIWWMRIRRIECTCWINISFIQPEWAHWMFSTDPHCPMTRPDERRKKSLARFNARNKRKNKYRV